MVVKMQLFCEIKQYFPLEIILFKLAELEQNGMPSQCITVRIKAVVQIFGLLLPVTFKDKIILLSCCSPGRSEDQYTSVTFLLPFALPSLAK